MADIDEAASRRGAGGMREVLQELARIGPVEHLARRIQERVAEPAFQQDAEFLEWLLPLMDLYGRYFDAQVHGLEKVPREGGVLVVGNHSGAVLVPDTSALISAWHRYFGLSSFQWSAPRSGP